MIVVGETYGPHLVVEFLGAVGRGRYRYATKCIKCEREGKRSRSGLTTARRINTKCCKDCVEFFREGEPYERPAIPGERWGQWTVLKDLGTTGTARFVKAKCSCGRSWKVAYSNMRSGMSTRCATCSYEARRGERVSRECVHCLRKRSDGASFKNSGRQCTSCYRRANRNGRCAGCGYPLRKMHEHVCERSLASKGSA